MSRHLLLSICILLLLALPGCSGNIGDLFGAFPSSAFDTGDGTDGDGGDGRPPGGDGFQPVEVGFLESAQGVTGDVRNVVTAQVGARVIGFASAGTEGVHVVDLTEPERINVSAYITTIRDGVLTAPAQIDGGRVDTLTVVDNVYLVCVGVGSPTGNAVTIFHIPTLMDRATSASADLSDAYVPRSNSIDIVVPGTPDGKAGGVTGAVGAFFVATGGTELGVGFISAGTPGTWAGLPGIVSGSSPQVDQFLDVRINVPAVYASVRTGDTWGIVAAGITGSPPTVTITTAEITEVQADANDDFPLLASREVAGPGNYPLDLDVDQNSLFVTGDDDVHIYNITNPTTPTTPSLVANTGIDTIAVDANGGFFALGMNDRVRVYSTLLGPPVLTASFEFTASFTIVRGVVLVSSAAGRFVVCCAGERGLRVIQWSNIP